MSLTSIESSEKHGNTVNRLFLTNMKLYIIHNYIQLILIVLCFYYTVLIESNKYFWIFLKNFVGNIFIIIQPFL